MKEQQWICVQRKIGTQKQDWYNKSTLEYTRKQSRQSLLKGSTMTWNDAKTFGWECIRVLVTITEI